MCTAIHIAGRIPLFGRTLDVACAYGEEVVVTPGGMPLGFSCGVRRETHLPIVGMAHVFEGQALYYDAVNAAGLAMAALRFQGNAVYRAARKGRRGVASFELISYVLSACRTVEQAVALLADVDITDESVSEALPTTPLHWMIGDAKRAVVVESVGDGVKIYENSCGVLTNNPPFPAQCLQLSRFLQLTPGVPQNTLCPALTPALDSLGLGAVGLPGDFSSPSRFVRAVFAKTHTVMGDTEAACVTRFFEIMGMLAVPQGCVCDGEGRAHFTRYTSLATGGTYYFSTQDCRHVHALSLADFPTNATQLYRFALPSAESVTFLQVR